MASDDPTIKRLPQNRVECVVTFTQEQVAPVEEAALRKLGGKTEIQGFRPGNAPMDVLREKVSPQKLMEETIRNLLPDVFESLTKEHDIHPVIPPKVEAESRDPLALKITFVEKPDVKLKGLSKIKIDKNEPKLDEKEVQKMIDFILQKHQKTKKVQRAAKEGDQITMDFWGEDAEKKEIEGIRTTDHQVVIGSKVLLPGFEDQLIGMKEGDEKTFTLTFPEKYHAEHLQGKPVTFHVKVTKVEEITKPELTDEFAKKTLGAESSADFRKKVEESMRHQEEGVERKRREQELLEEIRKATTVDLAPELIDDEMRNLFEELTEQLQRQNIAIEDWLKKSGKKPEEIRKEMRERGEKRLTLRLGMQKLVEEKDIEISDDEMVQIVQEFLANASPEQRKEVEPAYRKGQHAYEQLKWQKKVERVMETMLA